MKAAFISLCVAAPVAWAASAPVSLPELTVYSARVANQIPAGTFAMPVTALRYEPLVDIQARNLAEGQADVTIRGGVFESTGFQIGALSITDPQTGHYFAEIPIAPVMLTSPRLLTGAALAQGPMNVTAGAIAHDWRLIRTAGAVMVGAGEHGLRRGELYQGVSAGPRAGMRVGADVAVAHSESDGAIPWGEHRFDRVNGRIQLSTTRAQTDLFAGYQAKFFGWPNLYTPFNSNETEDLETTLFALNHRVDLSNGDFVSVGAYHRRNKDDYAFNRFAPVGPVHPFQHTTKLSGAAAEVRKDLGVFTMGLRGEVSADELESTSLTSGRFHSRDFMRVSALGEKSWDDAGGRRTTVKAGAGFEETNRDGSTVTPVFEIARTFPSTGLRRVYASFSERSQLASYTALNSSPSAGLFRGNPNLGRHTARNYELGLGGLFAGWATDAAVFWRQDDSLVDWTFQRNVIARTANPVDVDVGGFELVARRSWGRADLIIGYTALTKEADYRGARVDASFYALNYAKHRLTTALIVRLGRGFEMRLDNVFRLQADNLLRVVGGDDGVMTAVALAYRPSEWRGFEVAVHVDNLWDSDFQEVPAVPASPRQASIGVGYAW